MAQNNRIFVSFAVPEDTRARDLLRGHARNERCPFDFVDISVKEPWDSAWKMNCRTRIRGCDGFIVMVSRNTLTSAGARWEIQCALEEGVPVLGVFAYTNDRTVPPELRGQRVIEWSWAGIATFINHL